MGPSLHLSISPSLRCRLSSACALRWSRMEGGCLRGRSGLSAGGSIVLSRSRFLPAAACVINAALWKKARYCCRLMLMEANATQMVCGAA